MSILPQLTETRTVKTIEEESTPGAGLRDRIHGELPAYLFAPGTIGVVSATGGLIAEVALQTTALGLGQSAVLSGNGEEFVTAGLGTLLDDPRTAAIVVVLSAHGTAGDETLRVLRRRGAHKPMIVHIEGTDHRERPHLADCTSDADKGACLATALRAAGATIADRPAGIGLAVQAALSAQPRSAATAPRFVDFATAMRQVEQEVYCA